MAKMASVCFLYGYFVYIVSSRTALLHSKTVLAMVTIAVKLEKELRLRHLELQTIEGDFESHWT